VNVFWYYSLALEGEELHEDTGAGDNGHIYWLGWLCQGDGKCAGGVSAELEIGKSEFLGEGELGGLIIPELRHLPVLFKEIHGDVGGGGDGGGGCGGGAGGSRSAGCWVGSIGGSGFMVPLGLGG